MPPSRPARVLVWLRAGRRPLWLGAALLFFVGLRVALPWGIARVVEGQGPAQLGRLVAVGDVDLWLLAGRAHLEDVVVGRLVSAGEPDAPIDPERAVLRWSSLAIDWSWLSLLRAELRLNEVVVTDPAMRRIRAADGRMAPIAVGSEKAEPEPAEEEAGGGWPVLLDRLRVNDAQLLVLNLAFPDRRPLELSVRELELSNLELRDGELDLGTLALVDPQLRMRRDINLGAVAEEEAAEAQAAAGASPAAAPLVVRSADISMPNARFTLVTEDGELPVQIDVRARDVTLQHRETFPVEVALELAGGALSLEGRLGIRPPVFDGTLGWSNLGLSELATAAGEAAPVELTSGTSDGELAVKLHVAVAEDDDPTRVDLSGRVRVAQLDAAWGDVVTLAWSELDVVADAVSIVPPSDDWAPSAKLALSEVRLRDPALHLVRAAPPSAEATDDVPDTPPAEEGGAEPAAEPEPAVAVSVGLLELTGGQLGFEDTALSELHRSSLRDLEVHGRDLRWPERSAEQLALAGHDTGEGRFAFDATLRNGSGRVEIEVEELGLPAFSPYVADAAGYWIEQGRLTVDGDLEIEGERYALDSGVVLHRLDVADVEPGSFEKEFGVPLDLALALLRDPVGSISLPIAAAWAPGESDVALASVVAGALRQALIGALTSPIKGIGFVLGSGDDGGGLGLEPLAVPPGAPGPGAAASGRLAGIAEVLEARPGLGVQLRGRVGPEDDPALRWQTLVAAVNEDAELPPVSAGFLQRRRLIGAIEKRGRGESVELDVEDERLLERWVASVEVPEERRAALAHQRAEAVRDRLAGEYGSDLRRIELGAPLDGAPAVVVGLVPLGS